jgi:hypothetical protein
VVLTGLGHDVDTVRTQQLTGRADPDVWSGAQAAQRFLITQDLDFSDMRRYRADGRDLHSDPAYLAQTVPLDLSILRNRYNDEMRAYLGRPDRDDVILQLWIDIVEERRNA